LALSVTVVALSIALRAGSHFGALHELVRGLAKLAPLAVYLVLESLGRMSSASDDEPMGSLPVCLPLSALRALRSLSVPREQLDAKRAANPPAGGLLTARDQVRLLDHPEHDLEVVSRLPKDHWTANVTGIEYQGQPYVLVERKLLHTRDGPRHCFLLQKPRHDVLFSSYLRYRPEEVRDVHRAQQRAKTATWVETFPFLWGLTSAATQQRLARLYSYDPDAWTRRSILGSAILAILLLVRGTGAMLGGFATAGTTLAFLAGLVLLGEAALRWSKLRTGELCGSVLGLPLEPLAKRCLRWE